MFSLVPAPFWRQVLHRPAGWTAEELIGELSVTVDLLMLWIPAQSLKHQLSLSGLFTITYFLSASKFQ